MAQESDFEEEYEESDEEYGDDRNYLIGGIPVLSFVALLSFALSLWRLIDDPAYSFLDAKAFDVVMTYLIPIAIVILSLFMVVCMIDGKAPGSDIVSFGELIKVIVLTCLYLIIGALMYWGKAFIPFVTGSFFGSCLVYFLAFTLFSVNTSRNPMLSSNPQDQKPPTSYFFYSFLVPAGFGLLNAGCYLLFVRLAGLSRLSAAKLTATIGFVVIQLIGHKNYPGFTRGEYLCYLAGSLGLYVFAFTGVCLWTEEAILAQSASFFGLADATNGTNTSAVI